MWTKIYVIKPLIEEVSPTTSTGKIPEITAQNTPTIQHESGLIDRLKEGVPLIMVEIQGL